MSTSDSECRYLSAPESAMHYGRFGGHLKALGIQLHGISLRTLIQRGWFRPRLRVAIPASALLSWSNFPEQCATGIEACPDEDGWGLDAWTARDGGWRGPQLPIPKLWMHWLDDPENATGQKARAHAIDLTEAPSEPAPLVHPGRGLPVCPWIDYFADWQAYHLAEFMRSTEFVVHGVLDTFRSADSAVREHTKHFETRARALAAQWEERGRFLDQVACYRTIRGHCVYRQDFDKDVRLGTKAWAEQWGVDSTSIRGGIRQLLEQWRIWESEPPLHSQPLMRRLQDDIECALSMLRDLTDQVIGPFDPHWHSGNRRPGRRANLIDALPYEEWLALRDFPARAVTYQQHWPQVFMRGEQQFADLLRQHWDGCLPLRRFCLAWVRLHEELDAHRTDFVVDQTIPANEQIEQVNLIGLHTERVLRYVHAQIDKPEPEIKPIVRAAIERSVRLTAKAYLNAACKRFSELLDGTRLHQQRAAENLTISSSAVDTGSTAADQLVAAHLNALILRNYAAHHDYLDDELIHPSCDEERASAASVLVSSCLLVVVAAIDSLRDKAGAAS